MGKFCHRFLCHSNLPYLWKDQVLLCISCCPDNRTRPRRFASTGISNATNLPHEKNLLNNEMLLDMQRVLQPLWKHRAFCWSMYSVQSFDLRSGGLSEQHSMGTKHVNISAWVWLINLRAVRIWRSWLKIARPDDLNFLWLSFKHDLRQSYGKIRQCWL